MNPQPSQQDLLKLALSLSDRSGGASSATPSTSGTDIEWLKQMLSSLETTEQKVQRMLGELGAPTTSVASVQALLQELQECAEDLDVAVQIAASASELLVRLLAHDVAAVRQWAASVVATCAMNNRRASLCLLDAGALVQVMARLAVDTEDDAVVNKFVTALSALTNDALPARVHFLANGGVAVLEGVLSRSVARGTRAKVFYFAKKLLVANGAHASSAFATARFLRLTVAALASGSSDDDNDSVSANAAAVIGALLQPTVSQEALVHLRSCGFQAVASERLAALRGAGDEHEDEVASIEQALSAFQSAHTAVPHVQASLPLLM
jgi:hypothetical protein